MRPHVGMRSSPPGDWAPRALSERDPRQVPNAAFVHDTEFLTSPLSMPSAASTSGSPQGSTVMGSRPWATASNRRAAPVTPNSPLTSTDERPDLIGCESCRLRFGAADGPVRACGDELILIFDLDAPGQGLHPDI